MKNFSCEKYFSLEGDECYASNMEKDEVFLIEQRRNEEKVVNLNIFRFITHTSRKVLMIFETLKVNS